MEENIVNVQLPTNLRIWGKDYLFFFFFFFWSLNIFYYQNQNKTKSQIITKQQMVKIK